MVVLTVTNNWEWFTLYYKWDNDAAEKFAIGSAIPMVSSFYRSPFPCTTIGIEGRMGWGIEYAEYGAAIVLGLVFPFSSRLQIFSDLLLEATLTSDWDNRYYHGLITEWLTPGFDAGIIFKFGQYNDLFLSAKYRGLFYDGKYAHSVAVGFGSDYSIR